MTFILNNNNNNTAVIGKASKSITVVFQINSLYYVPYIVDIVNVCSAQ